MWQDLMLILKTIKGTGSRNGSGRDDADLIKIIKNKVYQEGICNMLKTKIINSGFAPDHRIYTG